MSLQTKRKGVAAVEFALVAPLLCMAFLSMIEISRAIQVSQIITNAARDGARCISQTVSGPTAPWTQQAGTQAGATEVINDYLTNANTYGNTGLPTVTPTYTELTDPTGIKSYQVTITIPYSQVAYFPPIFLKGNLTARCVFRSEKQGGEP